MDKISDGQFWAGICGKKSYEALLQRILEDYRAGKNYATAELSEGLRLIFREKGTREEFERPYFHKRHFTAACALSALIYPEQAEYLQLLKQNIISTCEEYSWAVPAHCTETEDETICVDLFASETAAMLAEISVLLGDRLGEDLVAQIERETKRRVFEPYHKNKYYWDSGWNNWTAVCCGNIGIAMMRLSPERFERDKERILCSMALYIDAFPDDGNCPEGLAYWHYGFGTWVWFSDVLYHYSNGKLDLFQNGKVKKIAAYAQKVFLKGNTTVSISDSRRNMKADKALVYFLHKKYPDECSVLPKELTDAIWQNVSWLPRSREFLYGADVYREKTMPNKNYLFEKSGQAIVNLEKYSLFVKAGNNGESHNHNDVGSFIFSTERGQIFCDLGAGRYFDGYFDPKIRYTLLNNASWGHSVPILNGQYQKAGGEFRGSLVWNGNTISVDFADAYGGVASKLVRTFRYDENYMILTDEILGCSEIIERFVSVIKPEITPEGVEIAGVKLICRDGAPEITESGFETHGYNMTTESVYLIDYRFRDREKINFEIIIPKNDRKDKFKI